MVTNPQTDYLIKMERATFRAMDSYWHCDEERLLIELYFIIQYAEWAKKLIEARRGNGRD